MRKNAFVAIVTATLCCLSSCDLLNCTQATVDGLRVEFRDGDGNEATLTDTLTVTACGTDSIIINRNTSTKEIILPLSYHATEDTFLLHHFGKGYEETETLFVRKNSHLYYESPDCPTLYMHRIEAIECTRVFCDSAKLVNANVNFDGATNVRLYLP